MHKLLISVIVFCSVCIQVHSWEIFGFTLKTKLSDLTVTKTNLDNLNEVKEYTARNYNGHICCYVIKL